MRIRPFLITYRGKSDTDLESPLINQKSCIYITSIARYYFVNLKFYIVEGQKTGRGKWIMNIVGRD